MTVYYRGADSVHLASALVYRQTHASKNLVFVTADGELIAAARQEGFQVVDPQQAVVP